MADAWRPSKLQHYWKCPEYWEESWRLEKTCCRSNSSEIPSANPDVKNSNESIIIIIIIIWLFLPLLIILNSSASFVLFLLIWFLILFFIYSTRLKIQQLYPSEDTLDPSLKKRNVLVMTLNSKRRENSKFKSALHPFPLPNA